MEISQKQALADFPWRWLLAWLILPNSVVIALWPIAGESMQAVVLMSGIGAIFFAQLRSAPLKVILASLLFLLVTTIYIARLFGVPPLNFQMVAGFISYVRPLRSPEYVVAGVTAIIVPILIFFTAPKVKRFTTRTQYLVAAVLVGLFVLIDTALPPVEAAGLQPPRPGQPIDAASRQVGLAPATAEGRHVLVIVVEALGVPLFEPERQIFKDDWHRPEWRQRYEMTFGTNRYAGSTTFGELRELCGISANYDNFDFSKVNCLPDKYANAGYETTAIHAFDASFFRRQEWYPKIGFQNTLFRKDLKARGISDCPGIFPGSCDVEIGPIVLERIIDADRPQFVYWLTLNTHTPVVSDPKLGTDRCTLGPEEWRSEFPAICRVYELHHLLADSVSKIIMNPEFPPTDILIVGDHKAIIFDQQSNPRFIRDRVPWLYLRARYNKAGSTQLDSIRMLK
ncbi:MAG: hypothetical protein EOO38_03680 [Cytophagaceae bacterium]|nr:MAG: hypothetical protein EOO38_03680 [Cytophagaceae bacterium]